MDYAVKMVFAIYVVVPQKNIHNIYGLSRGKKSSPNALIQQSIDKGERSAVPGNGVPAIYNPSDLWYYFLILLVDGRGP